MTPPHSGHFKFGDRPLRASLLLFVVQGYRWPRIPTLLPLSSLLAGSSSHLVVVSNNGSRIRVHPRTNSRCSFPRLRHALELNAPYFLDWLSKRNTVNCPPHDEELVLG